MSDNWPTKKTKVNRAGLFSFMGTVERLQAALKYACEDVTLCDEELMLLVKEKPRPKPDTITSAFGAFLRTNQGLDAQYAAIAGRNANGQDWRW